jgi:hypothetical protein
MAIRKGLLSHRYFLLLKILYYNFFSLVGE